MLSTIEDAPVSTRNRRESDPFTKAVTYIRLSPAMANGIYPTGVSFIILAFALNDINTKMNTTKKCFICDFMVRIYTYFFICVL